MVERKLEILGLLENLPVRSLLHACTTGMESERCNVSWSLSLMRWAKCSTTSFVANASPSQGGQADLLLSSLHEKWPPRNFFSTPFLSFLMIVRKPPTAPACLEKSEEVMSLSSLLGMTMASGLAIAFFTLLKASSSSSVHVIFSDEPRDPMTCSRG